jgi:hypothetical protein
MNQGRAPLEVQLSDLYARHLLESNPGTAISGAFTATVHFVLSIILQDYADVEGLPTKLSDLHQRVSSGLVASVRKVEIQLFNAGKVRYTIYRCQYDPVS